MTETIEISQRARELFSELMDRSEIQLDLAYTALIFNDKDIAHDVTDLHNKIEQLYVEFEELILKLAKQVEAPEKLWSLLRTGDSVKGIVDAAQSLAETVLSGFPAHPILQSIFESSKEAVSKIAVQEHSQLDETTLEDIKLQDMTGMRVICIKREDDWIYGPSGGTRIKGGDILVVKGPRSAENALRNLADAHL